MSARHSIVTAATAAVIAVAVSAGAALAQQAQPRQAAVELAPHRAIYTFSLGSARGNKGVAALSGRMVYEFTGSRCDGFTQSMRFVTRSTSQEGETVLNDQRSTGWENAEATRYRFQSSQLRNEKIAEQTAGTAMRPDGQGDIKVELTHPEQQTTEIGAKALFPLQHSIKLLEAAQRGETTFTADFYDGSDGGEKSYVVVAQIGRQMKAGTNKTLPRVGQADKLDNMPVWPVALSYFEHGAEAKDAVPAYEMSFLIFQNGVSRRIVIDNGEYTMKGELSDFTLLDAMPCRK